MSHLDLVRCFGRYLRRAAIPFWYTEGFNPHPFLTFALPLSLGTAGMRESVDIKLTEDMPLDTLCERLNGCLPEGLRIIDAAPPVKKATEITHSLYRIAISGSDDIATALEAFLSSEEIVTQKKNKKKKLVDINLKPAIKEFSVSKTDDGALLCIALSSGCTENVNPSLVLDAFSNQTGHALDYVDIIRERILCGDSGDFE
ncbi:MAG: DUF2344 domain-containing protein [Clostridia bacterium]|nr:DUF2344 domain-containing protein [Clostridia bacterium]